MLEVLIHDPLYKWQMTPTKAQRKQQDTLAGGGLNMTTISSGSMGVEAENSSGTEGIGGKPGGGQMGNIDAERALLRVKQKLEGLDGGEGEARGIEGQVQSLLQEAQDPERLCRMFVGWAAWL